MQVEPSRLIEVQAKSGCSACNFLEFRPAFDLFVNTSEVSGDAKRGFPSKSRGRLAKANPCSPDLLELALISLNAMLQRGHSVFQISQNPKFARNLILMRSCSRRRLRVLLWMVGLGLLFALYTSGLSRNPPGFYVDDESAPAYNACLVAQTGAGEFGPLFPLFFQYYTDGCTKIRQPLVQAENARITSERA